MITPRVLFPGDRYEVASGGINPTQVNPLAIEAMREVGVDISGHRSKTAGSLLGQHFSYVITVCDNANERCPTFPGVVTRIHWPLEDPVLATGSDAERLAVFRRVRDEIGQRIRAFIAAPTPSKYGECRTPKRWRLEASMYHRGKVLASEQPLFQMSARARKGGATPPRSSTCRWR